MKKLFVIGATAFAPVFGLMASDNEALPEEGSSGEQAAVEQNRQEEVKYFTALPYCSFVEGSAEVLVPGAKEYVPVQENRFYPFTSVFRTTAPTSKLKVSFGKTSHVLLRGVGSFSSKDEQIGSKQRTLVLGEGKVKLLLPQNMRSGYFFVSSIGFRATDLSGESEYERKLTGDGDDVLVKCVSGSMNVEGRHFLLSRLQAQNAVRIRTSHDVLFTRIEGISGDLAAKLDQGLVEVKNYETGTSVIEQKFLNWKVSPMTNIRIHRAKPSLSENMAVTLMTFDASGVMCNCTSFVEKHYEINSGEISPKAREQKAEQAKLVQAEGMSEVAPSEQGVSAPAEKQEDEAPVEALQENKPSSEEFNF